jgi:MFS transporter, FHS family, L-fucose permease
LNNMESYLVATAFYIAYLVMAIPAGKILKRVGFKRGMSMGLGVIAFGALIFIPAAMTRTYGLFLTGLFVQGSGLALLQTASNPYVTILGPIESAAKRISIMGICNKLAGAIAPIILGAVALKDVDNIVKRLDQLSDMQKAAELDALASRVITPYIAIISVLIILSILLRYVKLPEIDTEQEDKEVASANTNKKSILQFPHLLLGVMAIFLYVGVEVIAGDSVIGYGSYQNISLSTAKYFTTYTLIAMIVGYVAGIIFIPKYISQQKALQVCAVLGVIFSLAALFTQGYTSVLFIALLGLANSLMWPAIWPLALNGLGRFTKIGSSLLIMGVAGAAVIPPVYGWLGDIYNLQQAYWIMIPCYLFILYYAASGYKLRKK